MKKKSDRVRFHFGTPATMTADYLIALLPVYFWSIYAFGAWSTHYLLSLSFTASLVFLLGMRFAKKEKIHPRIYLRAIVTGFTLAFLMPANAPIWLVILGAFIALVPYELPFVGDYLRRYVHPIALSVVILSLLFQTMKADNSSLLIKSVSPVTPLASLMDGFLPEEGIFDLLLGRHSGLIGEVSVLMIVIGGVYLYLRRQLQPEGPLSMLATLALISYIFPVSGYRLEFLTVQLFTGAVFFTAIYLMPFCDTMPMTRYGRIIMGVLSGALTYVFRRYVDCVDGVFLAFIISVAVVRLVEPFLPIKYTNWKGEF